MIHLGWIELVILPLVVGLAVLGLAGLLLLALRSRRGR